MGRSTYILFVFSVVFIGHFSQSVHSLDDGASKIAKSVNENKHGTIDNQTPAKHPSSASDVIVSNNNTNSNDTVCKDGSKNCTENKTFYGNMMNMIGENKAMLLRTLYVLIALTSIIVVYFMVRAFRLRHKRNKSRKYGLITAPNDLEMAPLDQEDDDEDDMTVFELNGGHKR
ncbi:hypothetical protein LOTGIDRAFT_234730 [Lottia gigantea]|uniref:Uncharacterized protein n=1 Tax=Lottia gigantea TaxID=225164 RepID=V3ZUY6_LOTGI|nr:hypothetical protein LOTGIDRAFT_234730 [Lottia gigantea]ESO88182.1 hypothetical protein LOTGIDRAFT_234730 [Lottia gigantea]